MSRDNPLKIERVKPNSNEFTLTNQSNESIFVEIYSSTAKWQTKGDIADVQTIEVKKSKTVDLGTYRTKGKFHFDVYHESEFQDRANITPVTYAEEMVNNFYQSNNSENTKGRYSGR